MALQEPRDLVHPQIDSSPESVEASPGSDASAGRLRALSEVERDVLYLRITTGLSTEEIASLADRSAADIRAIQYRALRRLASESTPDVPDGHQHP